MLSDVHQKQTDRQDRSYFLRMSDTPRKCLFPLRPQGIWTLWIALYILSLLPPTSRGGVRDKWPPLCVECFVSLCFHHEELATRNCGVHQRNPPSVIHSALSCSSTWKSDCQFEGWEHNAKLDKYHLYGPIFIAEPFNSRFRHPNVQDISLEDCTRRHRPQAPNKALVKTVRPRHMQSARPVCGHPVQRHVQMQLFQTCWIAVSQFRRQGWHLLLVTGCRKANKFLRAVSQQELIWTCSANQNPDGGDVWTAAQYVVSNSRTETPSTTQSLLPLFPVKRKSLDTNKASCHCCQTTALEMKNEAWNLFPVENQNSGNLDFGRRKNVSTLQSTILTHLTAQGVILCLANGKFNCFLEKKSTGTQPTVVQNDPWWCLLDVVSRSNIRCFCSGNKIDCCGRIQVACDKDTPKKFTLPHLEFLSVRPAGTELRQTPFCQIWIGNSWAQVGWSLVTRLCLYRSVSGKFCLVPGKFCLLFDCTCLQPLWNRITNPHCVDWTHSLAGAVTKYQTLKCTPRMLAWVWIFFWNTNIDSKTSLSTKAERHT